MQNSLRTYILIYILQFRSVDFFPLILTDVIRLVIHELPSFPPPPQRQGDQLVIIRGVRLSLNFIIKKLQTHACLWCWYIYSTQLFSLSTFRKWWWGNTLKAMWCFRQLWMSSFSCVIYILVGWIFYLILLSISRVFYGTSALMSLDRPMWSKSLSYLLYYKIF